MSGDPSKAQKMILVVRNAASYDFGGAERLAVHIAQELQRNSVNSVVISRHVKLLGYAEQLGVPHRRGWWWGQQAWSGRHVALLPIYLGWQLLLFVWYLQLILRLHANAVHLMSKDDFIAGTLAAKLLGKRVVWTDCADLKHIYANHTVWYKNPVGKLVYMASKRADNITLVSFSEQQLIESALHAHLPKNYTVVHLAGRDEVVRPISRRDHDKHAIIFCATSRLVIAKGILELLDAFQLLSKHSEAYRLWLVGDGPDQALCKERAAGNQQITFWGHQEKPLVYLAASDIYVHPTHHEGFSLSLAEAAMLGKPMIASNVGGNPELVNDRNGILFPVHDVEALKNAMQLLGTNGDLRERLGRQARKDYMRDIEFGKIVKTRLLPLYEP